MSKLERENAELRAAQASDWVKARAAAAALFANDDALYVGVGMAQHGFVCGGNPECHVPLGEPGAVYKRDGKPHRIFATPFP